MALRSTLARNALSNWAGFGLQIVTTFFLTPVVLTSLGPTAYGVWALAVGLTGYYGLLDLGVRAGLTQFIARHLATRNYERMNQTASTGFFLLAAVSVGLFFASVGLAAAASRFLNLPDDSIAHQARIAIAVLGFGVASQFVFFTFSAVLTAIERFDLANAVGIVSRLATALASYVVLKRGGGLVGLSIVTAAGSLVDYGVRCVVAHIVLPELEIRRRHVTLASAREFLGFGLWNVVIAGGMKLIGYTDAIVIGAFMPAAAITPFAVAVSLSAYFTEVITSANVVFFPRITRLDAEHDVAGIRWLYLRGSSLMALASVAGGVVAYLWAEDFLRLWLGPTVLEGNPYGSAAALFHILMVGTIATGATRIGYQVFLGTRRVKMLAALIIGEGIANLLISVLLVRRLGLVGVALGTTLPAVTLNALLHPVIVGRQLHIPFVEYLKMVYPRVLLSGACVFLIAWWIRGYARPANWTAFGAQTALTLVLCGLPLLLLWYRTFAEVGFLPAALTRRLARQSHDRYSTDGVSSS